MPETIQPSDTLPQSAATPPPQPQRLLSPYTLLAWTVILVVVGGYFAIRGSRSNGESRDGRMDTAKQLERLKTDGRIDTAKQLERLKTAFPTKDIDAAIGAAEQKFRDAIRARLAPTPPTVAAIKQMSADDLSAAYARTFGTAGGRPSLYRAWENAIHPLFVEINKLERQRLMTGDQVVQLVIRNVRKFEKGWLGEDAYSNRQVYVETNRYEPQHMSTGDYYLPFDGDFMRDGEIKGANGFGATVSVPRYVDPLKPMSQRQKDLEALADAYSKRKLERDSEIMAEELAPYRETYLVS